MQQKTALQRYRKGAVRQVGTCIIGKLTTGLLLKLLTITFSAAKCFTLQDDDNELATQHQTLHRLPEDAVGDQFVTVYKQTGNACCSRKVWNMAMCSKCVIIKYLITCIILLQSVPSVGKSKCLQFGSFDYVNKP